MVDMTELSKRHTSEATVRLLRRRRRAETKLKAMGIAAISIAVLALVTLLWSVVGKAANTLFEYYLPMEVTLNLDADQIAAIKDPNPHVTPDLASVVRASIAPDVEQKAGRLGQQLYSVLTANVGFELGDIVKADPSLIGKTITFNALFGDDAQLFIKGYYGEVDEQSAAGQLDIRREGDKLVLYSTSNDFSEELSIAKQGLYGRADKLRAQAARQQNAVEVFAQRAADADNDKARANNQKKSEAAAAKRDQLIAEAEALEARAEAPGGEEDVTEDMSSIIIAANGGWARATRVSNDRLVAEEIVPFESDDAAPAGEWRLFVIETPEANRRISDAQAIWMTRLQEQDRIVSTFNWRFFTAGDSRDAELAGVYGALVGSLLTMLVTFFLAFPIGVAAAIYLEEFAPKNRLTGLIEVNINNLAAVPSIVFGLLGLAVALPIMETLVGVSLRSAPLIGGVVLALMSLPTIIIASRASIKAVPPSIREAALGVGASRIQASFHHVLPLAMPGILTGTIIALAQALGETAPLILIGMVAFIVSIPTDVTSSATVLPVQVFRWSDFPEKMFELKTALAICTLLLFLVVMNGLAIILRRRFERRW